VAANAAMKLAVFENLNCRKQIQAETPRNRGRNPEKQKRKGGKNLGKEERGSNGPQSGTERWRWAGAFISKPIKICPDPSPNVWHAIQFGQHAAQGAVIGKDDIFVDESAPEQNDKHKHKD